MTREEAIEVISQDIPCEHDADLIEALKMAINALEREPSREFAKWVAEEVIDEELWELNYGAFAELACRELEKLGIVRAKGDEWELVEPQESDHKGHTCKHYMSGERDGSCGSYICKGYSNWESEEV